MSIDALISLLDDPDDLVFSSVTQELRKMGLEVIEILEEVWESTGDESLRVKIEELIHEIQFNDLKTSLSSWNVSKDLDLLQGVWHVCRYNYPDLPQEEMIRKIEQLKFDAWLELKDNFTALEKVKVLNHVIYKIHKFSGSIKDYYSPSNSYVNNVIDTRKGNPISLAIVYSLIAQRLEIPIYGVNLPKNFILAYVADGITKHPNQITEDQVLFYINPFNKGQIFNRKEIEVYLKSQEIQYDISYFVPCDNRQIVKRILQNLLFSYQQLNLLDKANEISELKDLLEV